MKIAIVHEYLTKIGGAEKVLMSLHRAYPEAPIYTLVYDEEKTKGVFKDYQIITSSLQKKPAFLKKSNKFLLPYLAKAIEEFDLSEYDIVISSSNSFAHGVITKPSTFHISYCHSPMRFVWDWYHEYLNENKIGYSLKGFAVRMLLHKTRIWDYVASTRVDYWLANSKNTQDRIKKYYRKDSEILYPPVATEKIKPSDDLPDDYYLIVSRLEPYKKIDLAIEAFNNLKIPLVIIGEGSQKEHLQSIANKNIEFLGWQSDASVHEYLRNAKALVFPGEEDFGITPIESMAAGRPVVGLKRGGLLETIIPGETGIFFEEETPLAIEKAVKETEKKYLEFLPGKIRRHAENFSEKNFIQNLKEIVETNYKKYIHEINR